MNSFSPFVTYCCHCYRCCWIFFSDTWEMSGGGGGGVWRFCIIIVFWTIADPLAHTGARALVANVHRINFKHRLQSIPTKHTAQRTIVKTYNINRIRMEVSFCSPFVRWSCEQSQRLWKNIWEYVSVCVCVLVLEFKKTSVCRFRLCRFFIAPLFYLFSFFKSVYLTCFGLLFYSFFLSLWLFLRCLSCEHVCVCVPFFTPKKKTNSYTVLNI